MNLEQTHIWSISSAQIHVDLDRIMGLLGYETNQDDPTIREVAADCLVQAAKLFRARAGLVVYPHDPKQSSAKSITIEGGTFQTSKTVSAQLRKADWMALYLCTIGPELENHSKALMTQGDALESYIFDLIGSEAAESVAEQIHQKVRELASTAGLKNTNRFSPGYCEWNVAEQHQLFPLLPSNACEVRLSESALMHPVKSTNGIIGIGRGLKESPYPCAHCNQQQCTFRSIRNSNPTSPAPTT